MFRRCPRARRWSFSAFFLFFFFLSPCFGSGFKAFRLFIFTMTVIRKKMVKGSKVGKNKRGGSTYDLRLCSGTILTCGISY